MIALVPSDFSATNFARNCEVLGDAIGWSVNKLPGFVFKITTEDGSRLILPSVEGKRASAALLAYFHQRTAGFGDFTVEEKHRSFVDAFFAPFAGDPPEMHPTIQILQQPGTKRIRCVAQEPGLQDRVEHLWEQKQAGHLEENWQEALRKSRFVLQLLNYGLIRAVTPSSDPELAATPEGWTVNEWVRYGIQLAMQCSPVTVERVGDKVVAVDKIGSRFADLSDEELIEEGVRRVRGSEQRDGSYCEGGSVNMPGFVNIGGWVGRGTMVDTFTTVGSCAQIGRNVHLSGGVGIGGVLEPPGARPVIICDNAFIGSRSIVVEGVFVGPAAVVGAGVTLTSSSVIIDVSGSEPKEYRGFVPARSVIIPGMRPKKFPAGEYLVPCALIVGQRKQSTDEKTSLNEALREFNVAV